MAAVWTWSSIIEALGNTREVADSLEQAVSTVSGWKDILAATEAHYQPGKFTTLEKQAAPAKKDAPKPEKK